MENIYKYEDTFGDPASTYTVKNSISTGIMLSTLWNQSGIVNIDGNSTITYNEYCPLDGDEHSLTGCTNTAAAQIIYYFIEKYNLDLKLTLTAEDEYISNYDGLEIAIKADGSTPGTISFNAVNSKIANFDIKSADDIAALTYACGVVQKAYYSAGATSTAWGTNLFLRSGFYCAINTYIDSKYYWGVDNGDGSYSISDGGFEVLIENLAAGRVVGTSFPGHALVIDGYDSATDKFHINFGWGNSSSTAWYSRKEMNDQGYHHFMYDLMMEKVTTLTVNDSDLYGTGTMLRAFEQAKGITGDNIIEFTDAVKGKSLVLRDYITFADKTTVNNFNMSVSFTDERNSNFGFYLSGNSTAVFNNFSGEVFVNTGENYNYAFHGGNGQGIDITTNGALIYAGQYKINNDLSAGTTAVQSAMRAYQNNKTAISSNILESEKCSIYGSVNSDKVTLNNNTAVIGTVQLNDGNDVVNITDNSHLFGDVYLNSGNDTVSVTGNSHISGNINTGDGSDTVTIDSTSSVTGGFYYIENLRFDLLSQRNTQAMYYVMYNVYNVYSYTTSIVADITLATIGSYLLFEADSEANYSSYLQDLSITVTGGGLTENTVLNARNNSHSTYADLVYRDNKLYLDVIGYTPGDTTPPSVPGNISSTVTGNGVTISWSAATDNNRVYCYRVRYGKSSELSGDGDVVYDLDTVFSSLTNGTYYYQVCAVDASGNRSDWSAVKNFVINYTPAPSTIMSGGLLVSSANVLSDKRLTSGMSMFVSQAGSAMRTEVTSGAVQRVLSGGTATSTTVRNGGVMYVSGGGSALDLNLSGGTAYIYNNASAGNVKIHSDGVLEVSKTAVVSGVYVSSGGKITAPVSANISAVTFAAGAAISSFVLQAVQYYDKLPDYLDLDNVKLSGTAVLSSGATVKNIEMDNKGKLTVSSGATASIKFNPWRGSVSSAAGATVEYLAREANAYYGGADYGILSKGNTLENLDITNKQSAIVYSNGLLRNAELYSSGYAHISGGTASGTTVNSGGTMHISEGFANTTEVNSSGSAFVYNGGTANNTTVNNAGKMYISAGGTASNTTVNSGGEIRISTDGTASNTTVNSRGRIYISNGASLASGTVQNHGTLAVLSGGTATDLSVKTSGSVTASAGAVLNNVEIGAYGFVSVYGNASNISVNSQGYLLLKSGGSITGLDIEYGGRAHISDASNLSDITIKYGGTLEFSGDTVVNTDITVQGYFSPAAGNIYNIDMQNHTLTLDLTNRSSNEYEMVDFWNYISNCNLAVSVSAEQASGSYRLLRGINGSFTDTITVNTVNGDSAVLALNDSITIGHQTFTLTTDKYSNYVLLDVENSGTEKAAEYPEYEFGTWTYNWAQASEYSKKYNLPILSLHGDQLTCGYVQNLSVNRLETPEFAEFTQNVILLYDTEIPHRTHMGTPIVELLDSDGNFIDLLEGADIVGTVDTYMEYLNIAANLYQQPGAYCYAGFKRTELGLNCTDFTVESNRTAYVVSAVMKSTTINSSGSLHINKDAVADGTYVNSRGSMTVRSGGVARNTVISNGGFVIVSSGAEISNADILSNGYLYVRSGGTLSDINLDLYQRIFASNGTIQNNLTINRNVYWRIGSGTVMSNTQVAGGQLSAFDNSIMNNTVINDAGIMVITSGATANNIELNLTGKLHIYSGGTALQIKENGGYANVENGANVTFASNTVTGLTLNTSMTAHQNTVANNITLDSAGRIYLYGGSANNTTVNSGGYMFLFSGGSANNTIVNNAGRIYISSGGSANNTTVNSSGSAVVYNGGSASNTNIASGAMVVSSGGIADNTTVSDGIMHIVSGIAKNTTISSGGSAVVYNGGAANNTIVNSGGTALVYSGGYASGGSVDLYGRMSIASGASAVEIKENGGCVYVAEGANATFAANTVNGLTLNTSMTVHQNTVANNITLDSSGIIYIYGGSANNTTVNSSGSVVVYNGGSANNTIVNNAGRIYISSGGSANNTTVNSSGAAVVYNGGAASNTIVNSGGSVVVCSSGAASNTIVNSGGSAVVLSGGSANNTIVNNAGRIYISSGGSANNTTVNSSGAAVVYNGGAANNTIVNSGGTALVYSGGYASGGSVDLYGRMSIASGASAVEIKENGGCVYVAEGANATFAANTVNGLTLNTSMTVHQNTVANNITLDSAGRIYLYGGTANGATLNSGGSLAISGGKTTSSLVNGGTEDVFTNGTTYNATVMSGGRILLAGGKAVSTIVSSGGSLSVRSHSGALSYASDAQILSGGFMDVYDSSTAENTVIEQGGYVRVRNYGSAVSTLIKSGASMYVHSSSGYAYDTVISGFGRVYDGATMSKTVIASGGSFHLWRGGILKDVNVHYGGLLDLRESAPVLAGDVIVTGQLKASYNQNVDASQAKIVVDLAPRKTTDDYSIINLDFLGNTDVSITVSQTQGNGTYKIASRAENWNKNISFTIENQSTVLLGYGQSITVGGKNYTLNKEADTSLSLSITDAANLNDLQFKSFVKYKERTPYIFGLGNISEFTFNDETIKAGFICCIGGMKNEDWQLLENKTLQLGEFFHSKIYDVEKTDLNSRDNLWCGQMTETNMLNWIRSLNYAGYQSGDDFINELLNSESDSPMNYLESKTGMEFGSWCGYNRSESITNFDIFKQTDKHLRDGCIAWLQIYHGTPENITGGHAMTLLGFTYNTDYSPTDPRYYSGVIIADSDDSKHGYDNIADSPDRIRIARIEWDENIQNYWFEGIGNHFIETNWAFKPKKVSTAADLTWYHPNEWSSQMTVASYLNAVTDDFILYSNEDLYLNFAIINQGIANSGKFYVTISVDGTVVDTFNVNPMSSNDIAAITNYSLGKLSTGSHIIKAVIDSENNIAESFETNNVFSKTILVTQAQEVRSLGKGEGFAISNGMIEQNIALHSGARAHILGQNSLLNNASIADSSYICISSGGSANGTVVNTGGSVYIYNNGYADNSIINDNGRMYISNGGAANRTSANAGKVYISSGGSANNTTVNSGGSVVVCSSGAASNTIVNSGGSAFVLSGGYASGGAVNLYGKMYISSGAAAVEIQENGGYVYVAEGANATFAANTVNGLTLNTSMTVHQNTVANNITLDSAGRIYLYSGTANRATLNSGGYLAISGGKTTSSLVNGGTEDVFTNGTTYNATVMSGGRILLAGGKAVSTIVSSGGSLSVRSHSGALSYASDAQILSGGFMDVYDSSTAENTVIEQGGYVRVRNYGSAVSTLIKSGASMYVHSSSGYAYDTVISGFGRVYDGATMSKTVIASGGSFHLWRGGILKDVNVHYGGLLDLRESAPVLAGDVIITGQLKASYNQNVDASQAKIVVDLAPRKTTDDYSVISLDYLGKTNLTVNVDLNQADGTYKLASNAAKWDSPLALTVTENYLGKTYTSTLTEKLEINQKFLYNNKLYTLSKTSNNIMLDVKTVDSKVPAKPVISISSSSWTNSDVKIKATYCNESVKKEYSFDQKNWYAYTGEVVVSENKTVYFRGGNEYDIYGAVTSIPITFIDKVNPTLTLAVDETALTNQNVTITARFSDNLSGVKSVTYLWDDHNGNTTGWLNGDSYSATGNGTIYFKVVDNANNSVLKNYRITNIDKSAPELTISGNLSTPTSKVKLIAKASDNSGNFVLQYSFDRQQWSDGASLELTENCTVYFRAADNAGNETVKTLLISNIDPSAPDKSTVSADITTPTGSAVTVTMLFDINAVFREYSLDGKNYLPYPENGVVMTQNGTVYFRGIDQVGNILGVTEYVVSNIDRVAPDKPVAAADITEATDKNVTVTAEFSDDSLLKEYSLDGKNWQSYTAGVVLTENATVYFRSSDEAGNISEITEYKVSNIDRVAPDKPVAAADITEATNKNVTVTATFSSDSAFKEYSLDGKNWQSYTAGVVLAENATVYFRGIDAAGNVSEITEYTVSNIDRVAPDKPVAAADITTLTNQNVTVTAEFSDDSLLKEYSLDGKNWQSYTAGVVLAENAAVYFRGIDAAGNVSEITEYTVSNIDRVAPELNISGNLSILSSKVKLFISGSDINGISALQYSFDRQQWVDGTSLELTENCSVYFRAIDNVGNETVKNIVVSNIDRLAPDKSGTYADIINATNKNVTVMAAFDDDVAAKEYSFDGKNWLPYPAEGVVMTQNGTVYFRSIDQAGNISEITEYTVSNIDRIAPDKPVAAADITTLTNQNVTVTATFSSDSALKEYSLDGKNWQSYIAAVVMSGNGTVYFRSSDEAGNISEIAAYTVDCIDKTAPVKPLVTADITEATNKNVTVTAEFSDDSLLKEYSLDNKVWQSYTAGVVLAENATVYFRSSDEAGNISEVAAYSVDYIDKTAPLKPLVTADVTALTNRNVTVTAEFSDDSLLKEYSLDGKNWQSYIAAVVMSGNGTVYFRGIDAAGNVSETTEYKVNNIDKAAPEIPGGFTETVSKQSVTITWDDAIDSGIAGIKGYEIRYGNTSNLSGKGEFISTAGKVISALEYGTYYYQVQALDNLGNVSGWSEVRSWTMEKLKPVNLQSTGNSVSWNKINVAAGYVVEISPNEFKNSIILEISGNKLDISELSFNSKWRVRVIGEDDWSYGDTLKNNAAAGSGKIVSNADGNMDIFFANASGYWQDLFYARHDGSLNGWKGTQELVELSGKNKLSSVWQGSDDANILLLSDSGNGDALFVDDVYTEFGKNAARISQIDEIRAGLGDDVVDMTSRQFAYVGNGVKIYGGAGNDTIWANNGSNTLSGDAGNDRIIGGKDDDVIIGGSGNDSMHGGGGSDIFSFGGAWGNDIVEQLADGEVTLWFENGSAGNWNAGTLTYTDGANSVKVSGVTADKINLKFGGDATALPTGAFADAASEKIFEDQNKGFLA